MMIEDLEDVTEVLERYRLKYTKVLAHPARFELTTSAFGGQFRGVVAVCGNQVGYENATLSECLAC
jgi:hypothetical protein